MKVDHLLIGAGMAGLVLRRLLKSERTVLIDQNPGAYKIGESVVPEQFHHPVMRALLPAIEALPSYSPKYGTTFVSDDSVASFPLPPEETGVAMHVARSEIEQLMRREWSIDIAQERVLEVDPARHLVRTDRQTYEVERQIIDCSGPAMVVGSTLGDVKPLWPVWATWGYFDVVHNDDARFRNDVATHGRKYLRYDALRRNVLKSDEIAGWSPSRTTILTREDDGLWTWQIPLFHSTRLSFGVVSRHGPVSRERYRDIAMTRHAPNYTLAERPEDASSPYNRYHAREGFARRCGTAATMDYILLADAFGFADPVYSVGTAVAVNRAIELADVLNSDGWSEDVCAAWCADSEAQLSRAIAGFEYWYSGELLRSGEAATEVRDNFLLGTAFQAKTAHHYGRLLRDAGLNRGVHRREFDPEAADDWSGPDGRLVSSLRGLLELAPSATLAGWNLVDARARAAGLQVRWSAPGKPELTMDVDFGDVRQCFMRVEGVALSFLNIMDSPYPYDDRVRGLFDAVAASVRSRAPAWRELAALHHRP
ncbi:MAG: hypothetical protein U0326_42525 [Polyangiales bacterium]